MSDLVSPPRFSTPPPEPKPPREPPPTVVRAGSGICVGSQLDQGHHKMDPLVDAEMNERILKDVPDFYTTLLNFPETPLENDPTISSLIESVDVQGQCAELKQITEQEVEMRSYGHLAKLLNTIIHFPPSCEKEPASDRPRLGYTFRDVSKLRPKDTSVPRYPDVALLLVDFDKPTTPPAYADFRVPFELKPPENTKHVDRQVSGECRAIFATQCDRNFVYCVSIRFPQYRVWHYDRSGGLASKEFNIYTDFARFAWLTRRFASMTPSELGFDTTFEGAGEGLGPDQHQLFTMTLHDPVRGDQRVKSVKQLWSTKSLAGRATHCWLVKKLDKTGAEMPGEFLLKQAWHDPSRLLTEEQVYKLIDDEIESAGFARCHASQRGSTVYDLRKELGVNNILEAKTNREYEFEDRICSRILLSPVGRRVEDFKSLSELVGGIRDCIEAHRALLKSSRQILHRDISLNNILLSPEPAAVVGSRGILIDFDYARSLKPDDPSNLGDKDHNHRTGTMPWMAINVLKKTEIHNHKHDLESFFWVLFYLLILPTEKGGIHGFSAHWYLEAMVSADFETAGSGKQTIILNRNDPPINPAYTVMLPFVVELRHAIRKDFLTDEQRAEDPGYHAKERFTYDAFLDVLDRALVGLSMPGADVARQPPVPWSDFGFKSDAKPELSISASGTPSTSLSILISKKRTAETSLQPISGSKRSKPGF